MLSIITEVDSLTDMGEEEIVFWGLLDKSLCAWNSFKLELQSKLEKL